MEPIKIVREEVFNGRGVLYPWSWLYSLSDGKYKGTPLQSIRRIAKRLADQQGTTVVETWK